MKTPLFFKAILVLTLQTLLAGHALAQENLAALAEKIKPAVVTIVSYDAAGKPKNQGSGFFISEKGQFITTCHILAGAARLEVKTYDGRRYAVEARLVEEPLWDLVLAAIKPQGKGISFLKMVEAIPAVGERVVLVGNPVGQEYTVSEGEVSSIREISGFGKILEIAASLAPGFSGSPVVNLGGDVVGIAVLQCPKIPLCNYAIPGNRALALLRREAK
jgi:serine protease Do